MKNMIITGLLALTAIAAGCNVNSNSAAAAATVQHDTSKPVQPQPVAQAEPAQQKKYVRGQRVPNEMVCMVNNAFMETRQIEVQFKGNTYYGCCDMCKERITKDESVRTATDPQTGKPVDKASAYVVLIGDNGEVAYFTSEATYKMFLDGAGKRQ